jgi:hypothetical protein
MDRTARLDGHLRNCHPQVQTAAQWVETRVRIDRFVRLSRMGYAEEQYCQTNTVDQPMGYEQRPEVPPIPAVT